MDGSGSDRRKRGAPGRTGIFHLVLWLLVCAFLGGAGWGGARMIIESRRRAVNSTLGQIVKVTSAYQEPNPDFFPAPSQRPTAP